MEKDEYFTLACPSPEGLFKSKGSKFFGYAFPVYTEDEVNVHLEEIKDKHHKARHHCYAYRLGIDGQKWRANDDGEPGNSAGKPILGQIDAANLSNVLIVVVRYFGGTKLGVSGLIEAYKLAALDAITQSEIIQRFLKQYIQINTDYAHLSDLMNAIKSGEWEIIEQKMELKVNMKLACKASVFDANFTKLWLNLAKAYPGEEQLDSNPEGYKVEILSID